MHQLYDNNMTVNEDDLNSAQELHRDQILRMEQEIQKYKRLNDNLLRIMRERANQKRGIRPKKDHDGYVVLYSQQCTDKDDQGHFVPAWRTLIQTPYDAGIQYELVWRQISIDLMYVLMDLQIPCRNEEDDNGIFSKYMSADGTIQNNLYKWRYRANYRSGLWEIEIYTTDSVSVPENRRPVPAKTDRPVTNDKQNLPEKMLFS